MDKLHARIRQLESDNASLALAAEKAAALAEEFAADAALYRSGAKSSEDSLVNELNDASRRKDRRIQRLASLLDTERDEKADLERKVIEMQKFLDLAGQTESTLRGIVHELRGGSGAPGNDAASVFGSILSTIGKFLPRGDIDFVSVYWLCFNMEKRARSLKLLHGSLDSSSFASMAELILNCVQRCVAWLFETPLNVVQRGTSLLQPITVLEKTFTKLGNEISGEQYYRWTEDFFNMKYQGILTSVTAIAALIPENFTKTVEVSNVEFQNVCDSRAASTTMYDDKAAGKSGPHELEVKLNATRVVLQQKNKELDNMRVRQKVFEERIKRAEDDVKENNQLKEQLSMLQSKLEEAERAPTVVEPLKAVNMIREQRKQTKRKLVVEHVSHSSPLEQAPLLRECHELRSSIVRRDLQALEPDGVHSEDHVDKVRNILLYNAVSKALSDSRVAASKSRVIRLDRESLQPVTRGATMSRQGILQSLSLLSRVSQGTVNALRFGKIVEMHLTSNQDVHQILPLIRKCFAS